LDEDVVLSPDDPDKIMQAKQTIEELKEHVRGIGVLTKEGIVIVSENNPKGADYSSLPQFPANDNSTITFLRYYDLVRKNDFYAIGGPIYDKVEKTKVIGAISINVDLETIGALMEETLDNGHGDEVYLIDNTGLLLSSSEYIGQGNKNGILIQEVKSEGAQACLEDLDKYKKDDIDGESEEVEEHEEKVLRYKNYMGNDVFGAHAYTPQIMGCVIAEESSDERVGSSILAYLKSIFSK
jgi:C4-dicarboxylate-specific signal transduction histidine kinase